jgi:hypothetical protein
LRPLSLFRGWDIGQLLTVLGAKSGSWLDTTGAIALITGVVSIVSVTLGIFLRWLLDKWSAKTESAQAWRDRARNLAADLDALLAGGLSSGFMTIDSFREDALKSWARRLRRETSMIARFAEEEPLRKAAADVRVRFEKLVGRTFVIAQNPNPTPEAQEQRERAYGEAAYALDVLIERCGGPNAPPRDSYPLLLDSDA